jgi:hypothetical protein
VYDKIMSFKKPPRAEKVLIFGPDWATERQGSRQNRPVARIALTNPGQGLVFELAVLFVSQDGDAVDKVLECSQRFVGAVSPLCYKFRHMYARLRIGDIGHEESHILGISPDQFTYATPGDASYQDIRV